MTILDEIEEYWDLRSKGFSAAIEEELEKRGEDAAVDIVSSADIRPGMKVLDLGCGPGFFSIILAKAGADVIGIDYSGKMVAKASENAKRSGVRIEFIKMDAQDLKFKDGSFDAVVSRNVLWNLEEPERCYREILRVLKPGRRCVLIDGNFYLRLFDKNYALAKNSGDNCGDNHSKHNTDNVDFKIIEDIAYHLPLSKCERPQWDVSVLSKMDVDDIRISFLKSRKEIDRSKTVPSFKITFMKGCAGNG